MTSTQLKIILAGLVAWAVFTLAADVVNTAIDTISDRHAVIERASE